MNEEVKAIFIFSNITLSKNLLIVCHNVTLDNGRKIYTLPCA